jgi:hypothetical protein
MLEERPEARRAVVVDDGSDGDVILAIAMRVPSGVVTFDMLLPRAKYDCMLLLDLIERYGLEEH